MYIYYMHKLIFTYNSYHQLFGQNAFFLNYSACVSFLLLFARLLALDAFISFAMFATLVTESVAA